MAFTPYGFDGSLDEAKWATMWQQATPANNVNASTDFRVTGVAGYRQVAVGAGTAFSRGVLMVNDAVANVTLTAPTAGQWHLIAMAVDWNANTVTPVALPGATTTSTTPTNIPTSFPTGFSQTPGSVAHMPLAWVWTTITSTTLLIVDVRTIRSQYLNQGIWGPYGSIPSGPAGARDLVYSTATNNLSVAGQNYLQGAQWYNTDTDRLERWYGVYDPNTNLGGATTPGWYAATSFDQADAGILASGNNLAGEPRINPGGSANVAERRVTVSVPTRVLINFNTNLLFASGANVNVAGTITVRLDGIVMGGGRRWHTAGTTGNTSYQMTHVVTALLSPGTHTITVAGNVESPSSTATVYSNQQINVWEV